MKKTFTLLTGVLTAWLCLGLSGCGLSIKPEKLELQDRDTNINFDSDYILIFGDLQEYTNDEWTAATFYRQSIEWISSQLHYGMKIPCILEVGDVTWNNWDYQWESFRVNTQDITSTVPYFVCTGNHDYDYDTKGKIPDRNSTMINQYCQFESTMEKIIAYYDPVGKSLENYVAQVYVNQKDVYLLVLEFGPRKEVLEWAIGYVRSNPDKRFILMTHEFLTAKGKRISTGSYAQAQFEGYSSYSTPEQVWQKLVYPNNNIVCVLCGHNGFSAQLFSKNAAGREVPQILFNLQYYKDPSDSSFTSGCNWMIQLWEFLPDGTVHCRVYNTHFRTWASTKTYSTDFSFKFDY